MGDNKLNKPKVNKIELTLNETYGLQQDLTEILKCKLKLVVKMDVFGTQRIIEPILKSFEELRMEFFKKHGKEKDGGYVLPKGIKKEILDELNELGQKKVIFTFALKSESFENIESDHHFSSLFNAFLK